MLKTDNFYSTPELQVVDILAQGVLCTSGDAAENIGGSSQNESFKDGGLVTVTW